MTDTSLYSSEASVATTKNKAVQSNSGSNNDVSVKYLAVSKPIQQPQQPIDDEEIDSKTMDMSKQLRQEALEALAEEPELCSLLHRTVLAPGVETFEDAVAWTVCHRMLQQTPGDPTQTNTMNGNQNPSTMPVFCPDSLRTILSDAMYCPDFLEMGHTMSEAVRRDALAVLRRDPACQTLLEVVLFYKGFAALVCHRAARQKWMQAKHYRNGKRSMTALFLQSQASAIFGVDIHPATTIGAGIMLDHGTGIVIGETATLGDGCTLLHGVTLGGTGKDSGDRHPKVGQNVLIGAGASILGNIRIGNGCKIGAGSIVLRPIPDGATAVGAPAKIIGRAMEAKPGSFMDDTLQRVALLHKSESVNTLSTLAESSDSSSSENQKNGMIHKRRPRSSSVPLPPSSTQQETSDDGETSSSDDYDEENEDEDGGSSSAAALCPYRGYRKIRAPAHAITFCDLKKWLKGCSASEIGDVFFALDTRNVGYVYWDDFQNRAPAILEKYVTSLDAEQMRHLWEQANVIMTNRAQSLGNGNTTTCTRVAVAVVAPSTNDELPSNNNNNGESLAATKAIAMSMVCENGDHGEDGAVGIPQRRPRL